jgi:septum site-determining protein MinC
VTGVALAQQSIRFRSRSFLAFVLAPEPPIADWLAELDKWLGRSPGFFIGRPTILDLARVTLSQQAIAHLVGQLAEREVRILGLENVDDAQLGPSLPPLLKGGRPAPMEPAEDGCGSAPSGASPARPEVSSLLLETPIRSGQSVTFPYGDVTVLGSVASGAELVAGGSIHIYGALRGRAMAGAMGNARARIFCHRNEAELLAIDGYYRTADEMDASLRGRAIQARLERAGLLISPLD